MFWTCVHTLTACLTSFCIHLSNAINDMNCIKRTSLYTTTISQTSIIAGFRSATWYKCHGLAIFNAGIFIIFASFFASSGTFYKCYHLYTFSSSNTHNLANFFSNRCATNRTTIHWCFSFYDGCSQTRTSGITTSTTVISR